MHKKKRREGLSWDFAYMTSMNGMNSLKISKAAIRNGCNSEADNDSETDVGKRDLIRGKKKNPVSTITYAEDSNESINGWNLETCNTCKVSRSEEGDIEQNHLNITREVRETVTFWFHHHVE